MVTRRGMLTVMGSIAAGCLAGAAFEANAAQDGPARDHPGTAEPATNANAPFLRPVANERPSMRFTGR